MKDAVFFLNVGYRPILSAQGKRNSGCGMRRLLW